MAVLHLFNPENDLALAADMACYTPPPAAVRLRSRGALLPLWFASEGDLIMAPPELEASALRLRDEYGLSGEIFTADKLKEVDAVCPWGWSEDARRRFRNAGVPESLLPDDGLLRSYRNLSHRRTSVEVLRAVGWHSLPVEAHTLQEALAAIAGFGGRAFVKFPWSSSGRGVFDSSALSPAKLADTVSGCIRRQGSVMLEPVYEKERDFAMLFHCSAGKTEYHGLSCFDTRPGGAYSGNVIASQEKLSAIVGIDLSDVRRKVERALDAVIAPHYTGPLGVDMMVARTGGGERFVMPCVEVNLRYTKGFVAMAVARRCPSLSGALTTDDFLYVAD